MAKEAATTKKSYFSFNGKKPSSQVVHICGGEKIRDSSTGRIIVTPMKQVRFNSGKLTTDDPDVMAALDKYCAIPGSGITENEEEYLEHVTPAQRQAERQKKLIENKDAEIEKLKAQLRASQKSNPAAA